MINAEFVEKALLGAILSEPTRREDVPWLEVDDFTNPLCRALWQHLQTGVPPDFTPPVDYVTLSDALRSKTDLHQRLTAPSQIAELQIHAPTRPGSAAYGQIIVEVAIRNQLITLGLKIGTSMGQSTQPNHVQWFASIEAIAHLRRRWEHTQPPPSASSVRDSEGSHRALGPQAADQGDYGLQSEPSRDLAAAETAVVKSAVHDSPKGSRSRLLAHLRPEDFSQPRIATTFRAVQNLASTGRHVDEITVAWELTRDMNDQGPGLDINELRGDALGWQLEPGHIRTVKNALMRRSVAMAGAQLVKAAENLKADLPTASERATRSLGDASMAHLLQT